LVVTYNSAVPLAGLLPTLDRGLAGVEHWRLIVVDNASGDETLATARRLCPQGEVLEMGRNAGYAAAINAGVRAASAQDVVLVLNPDIKLYAGSVRRLLEGLERRDTGIAVPRLVDTGGATSPSLRRDPSVRSAWAEALLGGNRAARLGLSEVIVDPEVYDSETDADWATGAVMAISAQCRAAVGEWDESYFLYSEEVDFCQRARDEGFAVRYIPDAVAEHEGGPYGGSPELWRYLIRNRVTHFARRSSLGGSGSGRGGLGQGGAGRSGSGRGGAGGGGLVRGRLRALGFQAGIAAGQGLRAPRSRAGRVGLVAAVTAPRPATDPGFVWFAAQDWWYHNQAHSDFQLMQEVARERPVLLVNSLGLRMPRKGVSTNPGRRIGRKLKSMSKLVRRPVPGLPQYHVMTPVMLPLYGPGLPSRLNSWFIRQQVQLVGRVIGVGRQPLVGLTIPTAWPVARRMKTSALLYNRSDLHSAFPEADGAWVAGLEDALLTHADRVLYVSHELMAVDHDVVGGRGFFLDHGVDLEHFAPRAGEVEPPQMHAIAHPRIGFFGGLDDYVVDMELFAEVARALPEVNLVLIGDATCPMDDLVALPNVHWLGHLPYERIPAFGRAFDVALMPWLDNEWIRFANPIKLKEYLALGLPVVTTEYPEIHHGDGSVSVAASHEDFIRLVKSALSDPGDPVARRMSVLSASWRERARALTEVALSEVALIEVAVSVRRS
jgi:GT2 family glycosyltransferase/glycosyltransferase involved in cell wall biosynthesis